jgi:dCMP deaminase
MAKLPPQTERATWDETFMGKAYWNAAARSSCLKFRTGALIVRGKHVISEGYNGMPSELDSCYHRFFELSMGDNSCYKNEAGVPHEVKNSGKCRAIHAEDNALRQARSWETEGATMYSVLFPCIECTDKIIKAKIKRVVYSKDYVGQEREEAEKLLRISGISIDQIVLTQEKIEQIMQRVFEQPFMKIKP